MEDIKVGDIVEPTTRERRKEFGKGIVISVHQAQRYPITVVFPSETQLFVCWDFTDLHLNVAKVNEDKRKAIVDAGYNYRQMQMDIIRI